MLYLGAQRAPNKIPACRKRSTRESSPPRGNQAANTALDPSITWVTFSGWHKRSMTFVFPAV